MNAPCAKGKYCWSGMYCKDTANPCSEKEQYCGRYDITGSEETDKMYKEDFKGGCIDMTTCPDASAADADATLCGTFLVQQSEPGKCYAVCTVGMSKEGHDSIKKNYGCTDDEKKKYDETTEKNEAAYEASNSGSAVAPTFAVVTTAAIAVFAALY